MVNNLMNNLRMDYQESFKPEYHMDERTRKVKDIEDLKTRLGQMKSYGAPRYPDDSECCHKNCRVCVYDVYDDKLEKYQKNCTHLK